MIEVTDTLVRVAEQIWSAAARKPEAAAIYQHRGIITFAELVAHASTLSARFRTISGGKRGVVGIATADPVEMIIGGLAAWKAGCAYLPLDPAGPRERLEQMLAESEALLVATNASNPFLPSGCPQVSLNGQQESQRVGCHFNHGGTDYLNTTQDDLAYVIYTSGSTGQSKGVAVTQANLSHLVRWYHSAFRVTPEDTGTQFASLTFDAAVLEIWPLLAAGASLHIPERSITLVPGLLRDYLVTHGITICFACTPIAEQLLRLEWPGETKLRFLLTGADTLRVFPKPELPFQLVNNYGPTECTVLATSGTVPAQPEGTALPSIGKPISGDDVYLLDSRLKPVSNGAIGQICIGGAGVARGYVGRPDLTAERFIQNPWDTSSRLYLTGDLGRKLPNGEFEFCGRVDDQIKIRGYRIEPSEIVRALRINPEISAAAVVAIGDGNDKQLAAYIVLEAETTAAEIREHLATRLPAYMIPSCFIRLEALPMTPNGKVDRAALPLPRRSNVLEPTDPAGELTTEIQRDVASLLSELLNGRELGLHDNFFRVGGHSLLAAQVIARIADRFGVDLPLLTVFESPSVAALSEAIEKGKCVSPAKSGAGVERNAEFPKSGNVPQTWTSLVAIQPKGTLPPIFFVHSGVETHHALAELLGPDQPFFGLRQRGLEGNEAPRNRVEQMAADYIEEILRVQPDGPYHLAGVCLGGIVAFEIAQQLRANNQKVGLTCLIDSPFPGVPKYFQGRPLKSTLMWRIDRKMGEFLLRSKQNGLGYAAGVNAEIRHSVEARRRARGILTVEQANGHALKTYTPQAYPGRLVLFWCCESPARAYQDTRLGWAQIAEEGLEVHTIPGDHDSMTNSANLSVVAQKLTECLRRTSFIERPTSPHK